MKKLSLKSATIMSRKELKTVMGGYNGGGGGGVETCLSYSGCGTGCYERIATTAGWKYACTTCCIA